MVLIWIVIIAQALAISVLGWSAWIGSRLMKDLTQDLTREIGNLRDRVVAVERWVEAPRDEGGVADQIVRNRIKRG
jgi:hypothetical protein